MEIGEIKIGDIDVFGTEAFKSSIKEGTGKLGAKAVEVIKTPKAQIAFTATGALLVGGMIAAVILSHGIAIPVILGLLASGSFATAGSGFVMNRNEQRKIEQMQTLAKTLSEISQKGKDERDKIAKDAKDAKDAVLNESLKRTEIPADNDLAVAGEMDDFEDAFGDLTIEAPKTSKAKLYAMLGLSSLATVTAGVYAYYNQETLKAVVGRVAEQSVSFGSAAIELLRNIQFPAIMLNNKAQ